MAQATVREGLSKEQVAYEQWVDTQPIDDAVAWDEMGEEARMKWVAEHMGDKEELVVEVQEVVEKRGNFCLSFGMFLFGLFYVLFLLFPNLSISRRSLVSSEGRKSFSDMNY